MVMIVIYLWCHQYVIQYRDHVFQQHACFGHTSFNTPTFQPGRNPYVLLDSTKHWKVLALRNYLRDFLWDPERSKLFYYDPGPRSAFVAARNMMYLRTSSKLR